MPIAELAQAFIHSGISAAPVVDAQGALIGVVSKTDLIRHQPAGAGAARGGPTAPAQAEPTTVRDIMTGLVLSLEADADIGRAAALMVHEGVHRLVVTEGNGTAVGIVSALDILRWLAAREGYAVPPSPGKS